MSIDAAAVEIVSSRDARSRADQLTTPNEAQDLYDLAMRSGDIVLASAVLEVATARGWLITAGLPVAAERRWATKKQAAEYINVSVRTVSEWIEQGCLPAYRINARVIRIDLNDVDAAFKPFGGALQ